MRVVLLGLFLVAFTSCTDVARDDHQERLSDLEQAGFACEQGEPAPHADVTTECTKGHATVFVSTFSQDDDVDAYLRDVETFSRTLVIGDAWIANANSRDAAVDVNNALGGEIKPES